MATTDPRLATILLQALEDIGIRYAVLHREADVANETIESDVDLAVDAPAAEVALKLTDAVSSSGIGLILVWPYDTSSLTTFWTTQNCSAGVQLDLIHDPTGESRYAARTKVLLRHAERGKRWMRLTPEAETLYLLSKAWAKADTLRVQQTVQAMRPESVASLGQEVLAHRGLRRLQAALAGRHPSRWTPLVSVLRSRVSRRGWRRLREPIGTLVKMVGPSEAERQRAGQHLGDALAPILVKAELTEGRSLRARLRRLELLRRPSILIAVGEVGQKADVVLRVGPEADLAAAAAGAWSGLVGHTRPKLEAMSDDDVRA